MGCCQHCTERYMGCHSKCKLYIEEVKERKKFLAGKRNKQEIDYMIYNTKYIALEKRVRRNKHRYK